MKLFMGSEIWSGVLTIRRAKWRRTVFSQHFELGAAGVEEISISEAASYPTHLRRQPSIYHIFQPPLALAITAGALISHPANNL
jgi:hypothetical protein